MNLPYIIAVDGTAASGKGTLASALAKKLSLKYMDTGLIYRYVALNILRNGISATDKDSIVNLAKSLDFSNLLGDLHTPEISECASQIARFSELRDCLMKVQRDFPVGCRGAVLDGRDIGTVIFPNANIKFFVTADPKVRAERRYKQLQSQKNMLSYDDVLRDLLRRDERDATRLIAPTKPAEDAVILDTTYLDQSSVLEIVLKLVLPAVDGYFSKPSSA